MLKGVASVSSRPFAALLFVALLLEYVPSGMPTSSGCSAVYAPTELRIAATGGASGHVALKGESKGRLGELPMSFEANSGQAEERINFLARGSGYTLFLTPDEAVLALRAPMAAASGEDDALPATETRLHMKLIGATATAEATGLEELPGKVNYFIGNDAEQWRTDIRTYARVAYKDVYPGVDLVYYGKQGHLEYDLIIYPGADANTILFSYEGADGVGIDALGDLVLQSGSAQMRQRKPVIYQEVQGHRQSISGGYMLKGPKQIGLDLDPYDPATPLIIDPVLVYSSYLADTSYGSTFTAIDPSGNVYATGAIQSVFPGTFGGLDVFVTKVDSSGSLAYLTFVGGSGSEQGVGVALDSTGNAYATGHTDSLNFPAVSAFQPVFGGGDSDGFIFRLNQGGSALDYSGYFGGADNDRTHGIAVDASGSAYFTGYTTSVNLPVAAPLQPNYGGVQDAFAAKLSPDGSRLVYSTYLGGSGGNETGYVVALDSANNLYVSGVTGSRDFPTFRALQPTSGGGTSDAFIVKIDPAGSSFVYSTYLGGDLEESGGGIDVDGLGNLYATGFTGSTNFPTTRNAFQEHSPGPWDAYVSKLNPNGLLMYSSYLGGSGTDVGQFINVDSVGNVYVIGGTESMDFPIVDPIQSANRGSRDIFVSKITPDGSALVFSTYLGGTDLDTGGGTANAAGNVYVTGYTRSSDFPLARPFQPSFGPGPRNAFITKISTNLAPLAQAGGPYSVPEGGSVTLSGSGADPDSGLLTYAWDLDNNGSFETSGQSPTFWASDRDGPDSQTVVLQVCDSHNACGTSSATLNVTNLAPIVGAISAPIDPVQVNTAIGTSASFSDSGVLDTHTATWEWGDGSTSVGTVSEANGSGSVAGGHTYTAAGVYTVELTVADDDGGTGEALFQFVVVYDPTGGFATGGGWIIPGGNTSDTGDLLPGLDSSSKATFGFVTKYLNGAYTQPSGQLEFQYRVGDFTVHSADYDWLVVTNDNWAKFQGLARVNDSATLYPFRVDARDGDRNGGGQPDRFIIKIWATGANPDTESPSYKASGDLGGGEIQIHK